MDGSCSGSSADSPNRATRPPFFVALVKKKSPAMRPGGFHLVEHGQDGCEETAGAQTTEGEQEHTAEEPVVALTGRNPDGDGDETEGAGQGGNQENERDDLSWSEHSDLLGATST